MSDPFQSLKNRMAWYSTIVIALNVATLVGFYYLGRMLLLIALLLDQLVTTVRSLHPQGIV